MCAHVCASLFSYGSKIHWYRMDGRDDTTPLSSSLEIEGQQAETTVSLNYLGTVTDRRISFYEHANHMYQKKKKKIQKRPKLLRKLCSLDVSSLVWPPPIKGKARLATHPAGQKDNRITL